MTTLISDIASVINQRDLSSSLLIILDSPLAKRVTTTYCRFKKLWGKETKHKLNNYLHPLAFERGMTVESHRECQELINRLAATDEPAIVAAASSMCEEERIINYLKALLPDERNDVLFAGYRAQGTLGREIQSGSPTVNIDNQPIKANAQLHTVSGYSAHADQSDLLKYVTGIQTQPKAVHLIHGEKEAKNELGEKMEAEGIEVVY